MSALEKRNIEAWVIGASAGGVEALMKILPAFKKNGKYGIFVVLHLHPQSHSLLPFILEDKLQIKVKEANSAEKIEVDTVYIAPPNYHMCIERNRTISLSAEAPVNFSRPSIDLLFSSAASTYKEKSVGIILTGANHDGAAGAHKLRTQGGYLIVQNPGSALFPEMPASALDMAGADEILSLDEIYSLINSLS